jgi:hypothetical protein
MKILFHIFLVNVLCFATDFSFSKNYVDQNYGGNGKPGFVRSADMNNDDDIDIVGGGGYGLFVYENDGNPDKADWTRHGNLDASGQIGCNGAALFDVDNDGDSDVVAAKYNSELGWWENPGQLSNTAWAYHKLGDESWFMHCMKRTDLNRDGVPEEFVANLISGSNLRIKWFKPGADPTQVWDVHVIEPGRNHGSENHAGLDTGDIDKDGHVDIAYSNGWYEAPDDPTGTWTWHSVTGTAGISNVALRDMDGDNDLDLITASGHHSAGVFWCECPEDPVSSSGWTRHDVDNAVVNPEGMAALDLDYDNDLDIIACDLNFSAWDQEVHHVYVYENTGTATSPQWNKQDISGNSYASHKLQVDDINKDGKADIISEGCGYKIITYYENKTANIPIVNPSSPSKKEHIKIFISHSSNGILLTLTLAKEQMMKNAEIAIMNIKGRTVFSQALPYPQGASHSFMLSQSLSSGMYIVNISSQGRKILTENTVFIR